MSLNGLIWLDTNASDIHLLPGLVSPQLKRLLRPTKLDANGVATADTFSNMSSVALSFAAQFAGAPNSHGVKVDETTGEVTVAASLPAGPKLRSFIITATAKEAAVTATRRIRVNVHGSISKMWLTPARLTVRKDAKNMRLSLLAQFDDGTIGDITNWAPFDQSLVPGDFVHAAGSTTPVLEWSADSGAVVTVDKITGVLKATAETGSANITVKFLNQAASATVACAKPWSTATTVTHVSGPGPRQVNFVRNMLFLPDGFQDTAAEKASFEQLVRFVVARLASRNRTRPFAALANRMNFFFAWVPSPDAGVSVLNELDRETLGASTAKGGLLKLPSLDRGGTGKWSLEQLINEVGLPTPTSDPIISVLDQGRIDDWQALYGPQVTSARMKHLFNTWLALNDRVILNERDTAFHMAFGSRPALDEDLPGHALSVNPRRLHNDDFDSFLNALHTSTGASLPDLWSKGKDNNLVVIICRSNHVGGLNHARDNGGRTVGVSFRRDSYHFMQDTTPPGNGFDITPDKIPSDPTYDLWLTVAHELGHSCNLGDEYGGDATPATADVIGFVTNYANLQARSALDSGGLLIEGNVKWGEWPRIAKAGVLFTNPKPEAGKFRLSLFDGKAAGFKPNDVVRLRTRPLAKAAAPSNRCKVESVAGDDIVIAPLFGAALDPAKFPAGSIVMAPVRAKDPNPAADSFGADLTLADADVLHRITDTNNPHNAQPLVSEAAAPNDDFGRQCKNIELKLPTAATNFPKRAAPKPPRYSSWTIGIYENGAQHNCGIFRPTGVCLMNSNAQTDTKTESVNMNDFCLICRYAIVDELDPTMHGSVEDDFVERYGKRGAP
jgi:hypothetical protein